MNTKERNKFRLPAEWEPQSGILLMWPHEATGWKPYLDNINEIFLQLADAITHREHLLVVTPRPEQTRTLLKSRLSVNQQERVHFRKCDTNDTWARDVAPISLISEDVSKRFLLLDFRFNGWGMKFAAEKDNEMNQKLHLSGTFNGTLENQKDFVLEGGSIETDGKGTLFTTTACLTAPNRNQPLKKPDLERNLINLFPNTKKVVWIEHGNLIGDDTDGHIDTILRCAPNDTLLYNGTDDTSDPHYEDLKALEEQIAALRTPEGRSYRLLKVQLPKPMFWDGERLPATYANFVILNNAVIVPTYQQPDLDKLAMQTIKKAFPQHEIIGIDASTVVRQHGSLHCLTMQFPKSCLTLS
ncbi:agmatine deiminase family protein [Prevotella brunnea]|uniref:Agmatine deiminase family protein n=1 Tax=Prevotella brunnea TaxID=2508867 RepID=A0A5C8GK30_9BACT|nr:agmatine deiminase family protein [Prevotella brunnea]TXJ62450.1 agmatine deiminase family protein [Prevotella brunnea]